MISCPYITLMGGFYGGSYVLARDHLNDFGEFIKTEYYDIEHEIWTKTASCYSIKSYVEPYLEMEKRKGWKEFCRKAFIKENGFYACLNSDGEWFDSADDFTIAVHWCCMNYGMTQLSTEEELNWMNTTGAQLGCSVIHSSLLYKMWEKGLVK